jgi:hypothetical protein
MTAVTVTTPVAPAADATETNTYVDRPAPLWRPSATA